MRLQTKRQLAELEKMTVGQMRDKYVRLFGEETRSMNRQWLYRRIAWRLQSLAEGGLSERAIRRAKELARDQDIRVIPPAGLNMVSPGRSADLTLGAPEHILRNGDPRLPMPGTVLKRKFKGQLYKVEVLTNGFEFEGKVYKSLSAVAHTITGNQWNGFLFFKLNTKGKDAK